MVRRILVIDDEEVVRQTIEKVLKRAGFDVALARDGFDAIEQVKTGAFDLILCDVRMPGMDGIETIATVRKSQPAVKAIVITGYASEDAPVRAIRAGVSDYLYKPFNLDELVASVKKALSMAPDSSPPVLSSEQILELLARISRSMEERTPYLAAHSQRVAQWCAAVGNKLSFSQDQLRHLQLAALLHDLGQLNVPEEVLGKAGPLSEKEREFVEKHPAAFQDFIAGVPGVEEVGRIVRHHHEHFDGSGYPDKLRGTEIPLESRIIAVVEAYDAMISERAHRAAFSHDEATAILEEQAGKEFDPDVVRVFLEIAAEEAPGEEVGLQAALHAAREDRSPHQGEMLLALGDMYRESAEIQVAEEAYREAIRTLEEAGDKNGVVLGLLSQGLLYWKTGRLNECANVAREAISLAADADEHTRGRALTLGGLFHAEAGEKERAVEFLEEGRAIFEKWEDWQEEARVLFYLSSLTRDKDPVEGRNLLKKGVDFLGDRSYSFLSGKEKEYLRPLFQWGKSQSPETERLLRELGDEAPEARGERPPLKLFFLGSFRVARGDEFVKDEIWKSKKIKALLAFLAIHKARGATEEKLMETFWADSSKSGLYMAISRLRKALEPELKEPAASRHVVHEGPYYRFNTELPYWIDLDEFREHVERGKSTFQNGQMDSALVELQQADKLYQGDYLEDLGSDDWLVYDRDRIRQEFFESLLLLSKCYENKGKFDIGANYCERILRQESHNEPAHVQLIRCYAKLGRRDDAVRQYHRLKEALRKELNVAPMPETEALYLQVIDGAVV